jgi:tetratricopeptide (TPR) repeat protein
MYANFLTTNNRNAEALQHIDQVAHLAGDNAFTHYNMGLAYLDIKEYEKALAQAHTAIALGLEQPALREKLIAAGQWREPAPQATPAQTNPNSQ